MKYPTKMPLKNPLAKEYWHRSRTTGKVVCGCNRGYGSEKDGLCCVCRGGHDAPKTSILEEVGYVG